MGAEGGQRHTHRPDYRTSDSGPGLESLRNMNVYAHFFIARDCKLWQVARCLDRDGDADVAGGQALPDAAWH